MLTFPLLQGSSLFTDDCCFRCPYGSLRAAAAVVEYAAPNSFQTLTTAELTDKPLECAAGQSVTVYSDSAYAVSAATLDLSSWQRNDFHTAKGAPIAPRDLMLRLSHALTLPSQVAIVKVPGHSKSASFTAWGNTAADEAAKAAAGCRPTHQLLLSSFPDLPESPTKQPLIDLQSQSSPEQKTFWLSKSAVRLSDGLWPSTDHQKGRCVILFYLMAPSFHRF